jgi:hypothetical protein
MAQAVSSGLSLRSLGLRPGQSMWDLWWTSWHWERFPSKFFGYPL